MGEFRVLGLNSVNQDKGGNSETQSECPLKKERAIPLRNPGHRGLELQMGLCHCVMLP